MLEEGATYKCPESDCGYEVKERRARRPKKPVTKPRPVVAARRWRSSKRSATSRRALPWGGVAPGQRWTYTLLGYILSGESRRRQ